MTPERILLSLQLRILEILGKNLKTLEKYISLIKLINNLEKNNARTF